MVIWFARNKDGPMVSIPEGFCTSVVSRSADPDLILRHDEQLAAQVFFGIALQNGGEQIDDGFCWWYFAS